MVSSLAKEFAFVYAVIYRAELCYFWKVDTGTHI
jgi:hypothetical protein